MSVYKKYLIALLLFSLGVRCFFSWYLELSNEETYYWAYASFGGWSHVDNPGMIGWIIKILTHHLAYDSAFFIRLISLLVGTLNTILIFVIGSGIKNEKAGWYAALLYHFSIYGLISIGVNVTPEVPQSFLWLLVTFLLIHIFSDKDIKHRHQFQMALIGVLIGLSILCKYNSVFLWIGILFYILLFQRNWFKKYALYMSLFITLLCCIPILWWNVENRYIGFYRIENLPSLWGDRDTGLFLKKWGWQIFYYNPINLLLVLLGVVYFFFKKNISTLTICLLLCLCIPMWGIFSVLSFFKNISLQWILVAGLPLLLIAGAYLSDIKQKMARVMLWCCASFMILFLGIGLIDRGYRIFPKNQPIENPIYIFRFYGWEQLGEKFSALRKQHLQQQIVDTSTHILASKWHQAAALDYYLAKPNHIGVKTIGFVKATFEYNEITNKRGGLKRGDNFYFITSTENFEDPIALYTHYFKKIVLSDTIVILQRNKVINQYLIYRLYYLKETQNL